MKVQVAQSGYIDAWFNLATQAEHLLGPMVNEQSCMDALKWGGDAAEGRIMIGSSTELNNNVPLEGFFALREAVFENPY